MLEGEPGIICVGMTGSDDSPPLVVIWDESPEGRNDGCSATNCIARVLAFLKKRWVGQFETDEALVVERDSDGAFDHVASAWPDSPDTNQPHHVDWRPLRWPGAEPRSFAAFRGMFGSRADAALIAAQLLQDNPRPPAPARA